MKFASSYEPNQYEADIYGAWEAAGIFNPTIPTVPMDDDGDGIDDRAEDEDVELTLREAFVTTETDNEADTIAEPEGVRSAAARGVAPAARGDGPAGRGPRKSVSSTSLNARFVFIAISS